MPASRSMFPYASALEQLPHLARQICELWGKEEFESFLNGVIMDSRDGRRQGLPPEAVEDLLFLGELTIARRALYASETTGVSFRQAYHMHLEKSRKFSVQSPVSSDPWAIHNDRREMGRTSHGATPASPAGVRQARRKKSWWRRLIG